MKKLLYIFISLLSITACDYMPENGKLDGMWQMIQVDYKKENRADSIVNMKDRQLYWSIELKLLCFTAPYRQGGKVGEGLSNNVFARFNHKGDSLFLYNFYNDKRPTDSLLTDSSTTILHELGIDGVEAQFRIETLTSKTMILNSNFARIALRKF